MHTTTDLGGVITKGKSDTVIYSVNPFSTYEFFPGMLNILHKIFWSTLAGTLALRNDIPTEITTAKPRSIVRIASEDWVFHSNEKDLVDFINLLTQNDINVVLFHNYTNNLRRFIKSSNLDSQRVFALSSSGIKLYQ